MKNKKLYLVLIPIVIIFTLSVYLIVKLSSTQAVITNLCDYNQIVSAIESGNDVMISYDACGAKADGKTNDFNAIKKAHNIANQLYVKKGIMKTVYACDGDDCSGNTYYIGANDSNYISVITNTDWKRANFIIDDYIDSDNNGTNDNNMDASDPVFNITTPMSIGAGEATFYYNSDILTELSQKKTINPTTTNLKALVDYLYNGKVTKSISKAKKYFESSQRWIIYVTNSNKQYIREGSNSDSGNNQQEMIIIDGKNGNVLTNINWTYDDITEIRVYPIPDIQISMGNGSFTTYTNNIVYYKQADGTVNSAKYYNRNIYIGYSGNVKLHNIYHYLNEKKHPYISSIQKEQYGNMYYGFVKIHRSSNVTLNNVQLVPHTPVRKVNSNGTVVADTLNGTYDITIQDSNNIFLNEVRYTCDKYKTDGSKDWSSCYGEYIINENRWGVMASNTTKNMFITNSTLNRIDAHRGITNLYVSDTTVGIGAGASSLTLIGNKYFYGKKLKIDSSKNLLKLRDDYGSSWDGTMVFNDINFIINKNSTTPSVIRSNNDENWNFGYTSYFPEIYIKNLNIDTKTKGANNVSAVSLLELSRLGSTINSQSLYYFKGNIYLSGVTHGIMKTENNNTTITSYTPTYKFNLFSNDFVANASKTLNINNYGGNNKVNIYLNSNVTNNVSGYNNTKFNITSENTSAVNNKISETESYFSTLKTNIQMPSSLKATIGSLSIGGTPQNVSSTVTKYTSVVSSSISSVVIEIDTAYTGTYIKWGSDSQIGTSLNKTVDLNYGTNTFTFTVTNANNVSTTYTIEITRAHEPNIESISINAGGETIIPFMITDTSYSATVKSGLSKVAINLSIDSGLTASSTIKSVVLNYGSNNIPFTITNEAGESKNYNLTVTRAHPPIVKNITLSDNNKLNEVVSSDRTSYTVDTYSSSLSINATPNDNTTISGLNNPVNLQYGTNKVTFSITNDAGESTQYTLTIKRWYDFSKIVPNDYVYNYDNNFLYTKTNRKSETILGKLNDNNVDMKLEKGLLKITNKEGESLTRKNTSGIKIVCFGIDKLEKEIEGKNIKLTEKVSYETFKGAMSTTQAVWKLFDTTGKEVTSGNIDSGYQLKIYYSGDNTILLDTYEINIVINEYLEFTNLNVDKENKIIKRIAPGTTYNSVINNISTNGNITIKDKNGSVLTGTSLAKTGDIIEIKMTNNTYNYTVSVLGDVTGDGIVSQADVTKLFQHYRGTISEEQKLTNAEILAGDVKEDNIIKLTDIAKLHQYENQKISSLN